MIFYDFEVFQYDWLVVCIDAESEEKEVIINDPDRLKGYYEKNSSRIWVGFNNKHYDQYIMKAILLGMNPKEVNDQIIVKRREGWQISDEFRKIPMINYDVMPNPPIGLKALEGFMGSDIEETGVAFDTQRNLSEMEIEETVRYCTHDVEETIKVFVEKVDEFNATMGILDAFPDQVTVRNIGDSSARITSRVLGCQRKTFNDEFDFYFFPCLRIEKYADVLDWFRDRREEGLKGDADDEKWKKRFYKKSLTRDVAGVPHVFGFGGLHGAPDKPCHRKGAIYHVDVNNYYPSMLIAHGIITRAATNDNYAKVYQTRKRLKQMQQGAKDKAEAGKWKAAQLPYKKMLNALSGAMKDKTNPAYDPRNNNVMCINGQLMLLDLIEHLEAVPGFELIQSNTDGLIVQIDNTDEAFNALDDACYEWETRCSTEKCFIGLALDCISEIYQKDVNNYLWVDLDGGVERCGDYVKETSKTDNDLPIVKTALVEYMAHGVPVEKTIGDCDELMQFQKVVKLSNLYKSVKHEHDTPKVVTTGKRVHKTHYEYSKKPESTNKCHRVFASRDPEDGRILKCGGTRGGEEKFGNTPDQCFIWDQRVEGVKVPDKLDKQWYIDKAKGRLKEFGL